MQLSAKERGLGVAAVLVAGAAVALSLAVGWPRHRAGDAPVQGLDAAPAAGVSRPGRGRAGAGPPARGPRAQPRRRRGIGRPGPAPEGAAVFPDGTWLPPLNGVKRAPPFPGFEAGRPFAPVVRIDTDPATGFQSYVHADGSRSATQMVRREDGGRVWYEPGWVVGHPRPTRPLRLEGGR